MQGRSAPSMSEQRSRRQPLGQHRHHPVGKVGRVAPAPRLAVERAAGTDIGRDVGDRHPDHVAAGIGGIVVGLGVDRVVVVAGVGRVDGDEGQRPQVLAGAESERRAAGLRLGHGRVREVVGDAVLVDGDERDRLRRRRVAQPGHHAGLRQAVGAGGAELLGLDQLALAGAGAVPGGDVPVAVGALVDGGDAATRLGGVIDADDPPRPHADAADDPGGERRLGVVDGRQPPEQPVAGAEAGVVAAGEDQDPRRRAFALPLGGLGPEVAHGVGAGDAQHQDRRQLAPGPHLPALLLDQTVAGHVCEQRLQRRAGRPLQPEGARDLALAGQRRVVAQEGEDLVARRQSAHPAGDFNRASAPRAEGDGVERQQPHLVRGGASSTSR